MDHFSNHSIIGVSLDGKNLVTCLVKDNEILKISRKRINNHGTEEELISEVILSISEVIDNNVIGIGIGVPSLVDTKRGIVYNVHAIPSWREVHLKEILESQFGVEVYINNDANCFAIGEKYFGKAEEHENVVGLILGQGVGAGIIFKSHLYSGTNCGAGELGSLPYKDHDFEHYCSIGYFEEKYGLKYQVLLHRAKRKDKIALAILEQYGFDLGNLIKAVMFTYDPEIIVIGGLVSQAFEYFEKPVQKKLKMFPYKQSLKNIKIVASTEPDISILGAVALFYDAVNLTMTK